jgi:signal transduction histidine kinase
MNQFDLLQHIPLGICTIDENYAILSWNKPLQNWTSMSYGDIAGKSLLEVYPHLAEARYRNRFDLAFKGGAPYVFSPQLHPHFFPSSLPNGHPRIQRTTVVSQTLADGQRILIICVQDVTDMMQQLQKINELQRMTLIEIEERKKTLQELEEANNHLVEYNQEKDKIMQILSHDLRSPISGIKGAAEFIHSAPEQTERVTEFTAMIINVSETLIDLINDFLDMAKINAGKMILMREDCDIREIAVRSIEFIEVLAARKGIGLNLLVPEHELILPLDRSKILQVFGNLLSNAVKFTPTAGYIILEINEEPSGEVVVHVTDTGVGIAEENLQILFKQFGQHQRAGTAGEKGTGLGLPLVKSFVELHGGSVSVHSEQGKGTTFTLRFPTSLSHH